jgi:hypothetical protein
MIHDISAMECRIVSRILFFGFLIVVLFFLTM